jgi:hypothetical protein
MLSSDARRTAVTSSTTERPTIGALVSVRGQQWVVSDVEAAERATVVALQSVDRLDGTVEVVWEVKPGRRVLPAGSLPDVVPDGFDPLERLAAFLNIPGRANRQDGHHSSHPGPGPSAPPTDQQPAVKSGGYEATDHVSEQALSR